MLCFNKSNQNIYFLLRKMVVRIFWLKQLRFLSFAKIWIKGCHFKLVKGQGYQKFWVFRNLQIQPRNGLIIYFKHGFSSIFLELVLIFQISIDPCWTLHFERSSNVHCKNVQIEMKKNGVQSPKSQSEFVRVPLAHHYFLSLKVI